MLTLFSNSEAQKATLELAQSCTGDPFHCHENASSSVNTTSDNSIHSGNQVKKHLKLGNQVKEIY